MSTVIPSTAGEPSLRTGRPPPPVSHPLRGRHTQTTTLVDPRDHRVRRDRPRSCWWPPDPVSSTSTPAADQSPHRGRGGARRGRDGPHLRLGTVIGPPHQPRLTAAFTGPGSLPAVLGGPYLVAQLAGAIRAALFLQLMSGHVAAGGNYPIATPGGEWRSFVMEIVLTLILVTVILNTATGYRSIGHNAALAVGATVALLGLFASPISGASMNPARTLGPDIVANDYTGWWVYLLGPPIGAVIAVGLIGLVRGPPDKEEREAAEGGALPL